MSILEWPDVLRGAGLSVYERPGWRTNQPLGPLQGLRAVFWHHDASPAGNSPGAWEWITSSYDSKQPSAQMWMDYKGQWRFVGSGIAYHAGTTAHSDDWQKTVGLETDHTVNELYSDLMLDSLHRGFAAIAKHEGRGADFITFHKIEARPLGRKTDPYLRTDGGSADDQSTWARELAEQRNIIQSYIDGWTHLVTPKEDDMSAEDVKAIIAAVNEVGAKVEAKTTGRYYADILIDMITGVDDPDNKGPGLRSAIGQAVSNDPDLRDMFNKSMDGTKISPKA